MSTTVVVVSPRRLRTLSLWNVASTEDADATLDDLREAVRLLEDLAPTARRVLGSAHPLTKGIEDELQKSRAVLGGSSKGSN